EHSVVAVGSRKQEQADKFATEFKIPQSYGSYTACMSDANVDIVYIGTIEQLHRDLCLTAFQANKHVLCEKPLGMNSAEVEEILSTAKKSKVFFMEAIWSRFVPIYDDLREALKEIGTVTLVDCTICVPDLAKNCYSLIMASGIYPIQVALLAFNHEEPEKIIASGHTKKNIDDEISDSMSTITLLYKKNRMAVLTNVGEDIEAVGSLKVYGTKGVISIPKCIWCPTELNMSGANTIVKPLPALEKATNFMNSVGLRYEAIAVREAILCGKTEHSYMKYEHSLLISKIMDETRRQIIALHSK
ncbi:unnamed protein product, partial [Didymodactylos carnosus]